MSELQFEWDSRKASENLKKHGVSFDEAKTSFLDENARVMLDPEHLSERNQYSEFVR